jgi:hypothetical protein
MTGFLIPKIRYVENEAFLRRSSGRFMTFSIAREPEMNFTSPSHSIQSFAANKVLVGRRPTMHIGLSMSILPS